MQRYMLCLGNFDDNEEWDRCLSEIEETVGPRQFQNIFAIIVVKTSPRNISGLFEMYHLKLINDYCISFHNQIHERRTEEQCFTLSLFTMHQLIKEISYFDAPVDQYMLPSISEEQKNTAKE